MAKVVLTLTDATDSDNPLPVILSIECDPPYCFSSPVTPAQALASTVIREALTERPVQVLNVEHA